MAKLRFTSLDLEPCLSSTGSESKGSLAAAAHARTSQFARSRAKLRVTLSLWAKGPSTSFAVDVERSPLAKLKFRAQMPERFWLAAVMENAHSYVAVTSARDVRRQQAPGSQPESQSQLPQLG